MKTFDANERRILTVASLGHLFAHFYMIMQPVLLLKVAPEFADRFGLTLGETIALSVVSYALFGLGGFPAGLLTDRWQARGMLTIGLIGSGACAMLAALADTPVALVVALAGIGTFASIYHPAGLTLISRHVRARGWALGINGVAGNLGIAAAPFLAAILADAVGWRAAFVALGAPGVVIGATVFVALGRRIDEPAAPRKHPANEAGADYRLYFVLLCVGLVFGGLGYRTTMTSAPALFVERVDVLRGTIDALADAFGLADFRGELTPGALMLSAAVLAGSVGHLVGGWAADRFDLRLGYIVFYLAAVPLAFAATACWGVPLFAVLAGYFFFTLGMQAIENSLLSRLTPDRWRSTAFGLKFVLTFGVGALGAELTGLVIDRTGSAADVYLWVGAFTAILTVVALVLWQVSRRPIPHLGQARAS